MSQGTEKSVEVMVDRCLLSKLGVGRSGWVKEITAEPGLRRRLLEMGLCTGTVVEVIRKAPLGDPLELRVRGYNLSLRNDQAACVTVQPV